MKVNNINLLNLFHNYRIIYMFIFNKASIFLIKVEGKILFKIT